MRAGQQQTKRMLEWRGSVNERWQSGSIVVNKTATLIGEDIAVSVAESVLAFCFSFGWHFEFQGGLCVANY